MPCPSDLGGPFRDRERPAFEPGGVSAIARTQKKAGSTVIREILSHRVPSDKGAKGRVTDDAPTAASATGNTYARRKDRGIASRKGEALHNLTQRLPWTGRRWKKLTEWNARLCGKKRTPFFILRCVYSCEGAFTFSSFNEGGMMTLPWPGGEDFGRRAVRVLSCVIFLW